MTGPVRAGAVDADPVPATAALRICVLVVALAAVAAVVAAGLASIALGVLLVPVVVACAAAPVLLASTAGVTVRKVASSAVVLVAVVGALVNEQSMLGSGAIAALPWQLGPRLTILAVGLLCAQLLVGDGQREVLVSLLAAAGLTVFAVASGPGPAVGVALALAWPALLVALSLAREARRRAGADAQVEVAGAGRRLAPVPLGQLAVLVVGSALVGLLSVLLGPQPDGIQPRDGQGALSGDAGSADGSSVSRDVTAYTHGTLDLRARGELPDTPVADVTPDSPRLWLGATLTEYDGGSWTVPDGRRVLGPALAGGPTYPLARDPWDGATATSQARVVPREGFGGVLLAPGHPVAVDVLGSVLPISGGYALGPSAGTGRYPSTYVVASTSVTPQASLLRAAVPHPAGGLGAAGELTALPPTVPDRVLRLGRRLAAGEETRYDVTRAVERYLRRHATYQLDAPVPPRGVDVVDHFLFSSHTGFCEQFASAEVVLLRAAGVPARLATGFAGGADDGSRRTLRGSDAHAWVEVLYPGVGWAASDPTAGTVQAGPGLTDRLRELLRDTTGRIVLALLLLAATGLGVLTAWLGARLLVARRRRRDDLVRRRETAPVLLAFEGLERALAQLGAPRAAAESIGELGRRPELVPVAGALAVLELTCYSPTPPGAGETEAAARDLDEHSRRLLAQD